MRSVTNPPAMDSEVQTTAPITIAAYLPNSPCRPTATSALEPMMSVTSVMPEIGLLPVMAVASAATVVNRKANTKAITRPVSAICGAFAATAGSPLLSRK